MIYFITISAGILIFGLLAIALLLKEKRALKRPALESCKHRPTCGCHDRTAIPQANHIQCPSSKK